MVKEIEADGEFQGELTTAGSKLVVVDFFATWCGPCQRVAPAFQALEAKYPNAVFLKIDVDKCSETASSNGVSAMPTFILFRTKSKVDTLRGANIVDLEEKIKKWYGSGEEEQEEGTVKGHMDLSTFYMKSGCECLNESDEHPLDHALTTKGGYLESDCDEQLIIAMSFTQAVKLHSLKVWGPSDKGPKTVKIFINQPHTLDFDSAEGMEPTQALELTAEDLQQGALTQLKFVKYQNVQNVAVFIKDNQAGEETTQIDYFGFVGSTLNTTNMSEFKRVAGKKGESH